MHKILGCVTSPLELTDITRLQFRVGVTTAELGVVVESFCDDGVTEKL